MHKGVSQGSKIFHLLFNNPTRKCYALVHVKKEEEEEGEEKIDDDEEKKEVERDVHYEEKIEKGNLNRGGWNKDKYEKSTRKVGCSVFRNVPWEGIPREESVRKFWQVVGDIRDYSSDGREHARMEKW